MGEDVRVLSVILVLALGGLMCFSKPPVRRHTQHALKALGVQLPIDDFGKFGRRPQSQAVMGCGVKATFRQ